MQIPYCDFEDTGKIFKNKSIYKCKYCGSQFALEKPDIKIICFKKHEEMVNALDNMQHPDKDPILGIHTNSDQHFHHLVKQQVDKNREQFPSIQNSNDNQPKPIPDHNTNQLCTKEQIDERLAICNSCEHFKDNSCLLCGCVVVREKNFNNKLAHKRHSCPINKWGPIIDSPLEATNDAQSS